MPTNTFLTGEYREKIPHWHSDDSSWKAKGVVKMLGRNDLEPKRIGEIGCGTGEVLRQLQLQMNHQSTFVGYDISPDAIEMSQSRQNDGLRCYLGDVTKDPTAEFDVLLVLDVLEHQENYFSFLRDIRGLAPYKLFHTVLDLSAQAVVRRNVLTRCRRELSDLHFFTKDLIFEALRGEHYEIVDWFYASPRLYKASTFTDTLRELPRSVCFAVNQDLAVRLLGGHTLFVLAR